MSVPRELQLLRNIKAAIQGIRRNNGYLHDVADEAVRLNPDRDAEGLVTLPDGVRPFVFIQVAPDSSRYFPSSQVEIAWQAVIHWVNDCDPTVDDDQYRKYLDACADLERVCNVDPSFGGIATDTRILTREMDYTQGPSLMWAPIRIECRLDRTWGEP